MSPTNRNDRWLMAAIALGVSASVGAGLYWIGAPSLLLVVLCTFLRVN
jgi:hypothetical protein